MQKAVLFWVLLKATCKYALEPISVSFVYFVCFHRHSDLLLKIATLVVITRMLTETSD